MSFTNRDRPLPPLGPDRREDVECPECGESTAYEDDQVEYFWHNGHPMYRYVVCWHCKEQIPMAVRP